MNEQLPELDFHPEDMTRSADEMLDAFVAAMWMGWFHPHDEYITGARRACAWLGRIYPAGPVSRMPYWPGRPRIVEELGYARRIASGGDWRFPVDQDFARGVVAMLEYAIGQCDEIPVPNLHVGELPPIVKDINPQVWEAYQAQHGGTSGAA